MTVAELIEKLKEMPPEAEVVYTTGGDFEPVDRVTHPDRRGPLYPDAEDRCVVLE